MRIPEKRLSITAINTLATSPQISLYSGTGHASISDEAFPPLVAYIQLLLIAPSSLFSSNLSGDQNSGFVLQVLSTPPHDRICIPRIMSHRKVRMRTWRTHLARTLHGHKGNSVSDGVDELQCTVLSSCAACTHDTCMTCVDDDTLSLFLDAVR